MSLTDSQKIAVIYDRSERVEQALFGPTGVIERLTHVEALASSTDIRAPGKKEKVAAWSAILIALITSAGSVLASR